MHDDATVADADGTGGQNELPIAQRQDGAAHEARILHPLRDDHEEDHLVDAGAEDRQEHDGDRMKGSASWMSANRISRISAMPR